MRILVVGAGATGGYFGARLAQAGRDVTFLVRPQRADKLRRSGLEIISPMGNLTLQPKLVDASELGPDYDLILLTVKAFALKAALNDLAPAVGEQTTILPILNGMKHLPEISTRFGQQAVIGGVCKIAATLDEQGRIVHMSPMHQLFYGELDGTSSARLSRIDAALRAADFDAHAVPDIMMTLWEKWILLASLGAITCLMRGTIGQVASAPGGQKFARALMDEIIAIAVAEGYIRRERYLSETIALLTETDSDMTSSMYRDLTAGYAIEAAQIIGDLITRAERHGLESPLLSAVWVHLSVYQTARADY